MAIHRFSKQEFEDALPIHRDTGERLWKPLGMVQGEEAYCVTVAPKVYIQVRSSVNGNGLAAETGANSIRAWLVDGVGEPLGHKIDQYTQRTRGWEKRLTEKLRELWARAQAAGYCPKCRVPRSVFRVKRKTKNHGRIFAKCTKCDGHFEWLTSNGVGHVNGR